MAINIKFLVTRYGKYWEEEKEDKIIEMQIVLLSWWEELISASIWKQ